MNSPVGLSRPGATVNQSPRFALGLILGMLLVQSLPALPPAWCGFALSAAAVLLARRRQIFLSALLLGFTWAGVQGSWRLTDHLPAGGHRVEAVVEGWVMGIPSRMDGGERFDFRVMRVFTPLSGGIPAKVRVSWFDGIRPIKAGESWRLRLSLRAPRGMMNPGGFDYEQWLFAQGIGAVGYVRDDPGNRAVDGPPTPAAWLQMVRQALYDRLGMVWSESPVAGLLKALTMGEADDISRKQWEVLRRTGTAHLIAISGSHIGLVAGIAFVLTLKGCAWWGIQRWSPPILAAWVGMLVAIFYSALADFAIPTQRALIMIAIAMGAVISRRHLRWIQVIALALIGVALWDPLAVIAPGFWLSYGAVALIAYSVSGRLSSPNRFWLSMRINWVTAVGLAPLLLLFFRQISLVSPIANLFAVPVLGVFLIPLCLLGALLLGVAPVAGQGVLGVAEFVMRESWRALEWFSAWPYAQWALAEPPVGSVLLSAIGVIVLLAPRGIPARWLGGVLLLPALLYRPERPSNGAFLFTLLDVGQGLSAVVETHERVLIFDTGARFSSAFDMGGAVIEPYLRHRGISRIDALVISHGDNDHIGGARSLLGAFPVGELLTSVPEHLAEFRPRPCFAGQQWAWDGVSFTMLGPSKVASNENDNSCVMRIDGADGSVLLTGDIETEGEEALLERFGDRLRSDILVVPHHGSKTSSSKDFLDQVSPRWALIPAGYLNRFGFPHAVVLARYRTRGATVMTTGEGGALTLWVNGKQAAPRPYRSGRRHYWQQP